MINPQPADPTPSASSIPMTASEPALVPLRWQQVLTALVCGAVLALSFPGVDWGPLAWVALVPFCLMVFRPRRKRAMMTLFGALGAGFYLVLLYWFLWMHPLTWLGFTEAQSLGIVSIAWMAASGALVMQLLAFGWIYGWLTKYWAKPSWRHAVSLALGWTTLEWLTSVGTFGFTWGNLALSQVQLLPMIQVLDLVGPFPLAGLIVGFNGAVALAVLRQARQPFAAAHWKPVAVALAPVALVAGYGIYRLSVPLPATTFSVELVQGNIAGGDKFDRGEGAIFRMAEKYLKLSAQHPGTDLVIWPETAMPDYMRNNAQLLGILANAAKTQKRYLMTGTLDYEGQPPNLKLFNAVTVFSPDGALMGFDYKRHLVPYGEYVPWRNWMPDILTKINILAMDFYPGIKPNIFQFPFAKVGTGVCYDGIFPDAIRPVVLAGAEVLALVTNDAWYKDTTAPRVLNAHAALRAVENRRYVMRAANTGICSVIEPTGNIVGTTPVFQDTTLVGRVAPMNELTVYTRFGDWASQLASFGFLGFLGLRWMRRRKNLV